MDKLSVTRVIGSSMLPTIQVGDVLFLEKVPDDRIRVGELVVFRKNGKLLCHRIMIRYSKGGVTKFIEKGDNSLAWGNLISGEQIIGRVCKVYRGGKQIAVTSPIAKYYNVLVGRVINGFYIGHKIKKKYFPLLRLSLPVVWLLGVGIKINRKMNIILNNKWGSKKKC